MDIEKLLKSASAVSRWELDNIIYNDRTTNPTTLIALLTRVKYLRAKDNSENAQELEILEELVSELDEKECVNLLSADDDDVRQRFIESLARKGALETLCKNQLSIETMETMCKLSPNDFILTAKRGQDIINAVKELVIQGETLSDDVAGA
jgi:uncharacterized protein YjgD (DUF1641 family)